jgi:hypothetical protein
MANKHFILKGQLTAGKLVLFAVVDADMLGDVPSIFQMEAFLMQPTIYTGTYPQIKINTDTVQDLTEEFKGMGIAGIITESGWATKTVETPDDMGINI